MLDLEKESALVILGDMKRVSPDSQWWGKEAKTSKRIVPKIVLDGTYKINLLWFGKRKRKRVNIYRVSLRKSGSQKEPKIMIKNNGQKK